MYFMIDNLRNYYSSTDRSIAGQKARKKSHQEWSVEASRFLCTAGLSRRRTARERSANFIPFANHGSNSGGQTEAPDAKEAEW